MPLLKSSTRFDPVLYKDAVANSRKKYRKLESVPINTGAAASASGSGANSNTNSKNWYSFWKCFFQRSLNTKKWNTNAFHSVFYRVYQQVLGWNSEENWRKKIWQKIWSKKFDERNLTKKFWPRIFDDFFFQKIFQFEIFAKTTETKNILLDFKMYHFL